MDEHHRAFSHFSVGSSFKGAKAVETERKKRALYAIEIDYDALSSNDDSNDPQWSRELQYQFSKKSQVSSLLKLNASSQIKASTRRQQLTVQPPLL